MSLLWQPMQQQEESLLPASLCSFVPFIMTSRPRQTFVDLYFLNVFLCRKQYFQKQRRLPASFSHYALCPPPAAPPRPAQIPSAFTLHISRLLSLSHFIHFGAFVCYGQSINNKPQSRQCGCIKQINSVREAGRISHVILTICTRGQEREEFQLQLQLQKIQKVNLYIHSWEVSK